MRRYKQKPPTPERQVWKAMKERCLYPKHKSYADYGGRGIRICDAWIHDFAQFLADMGPRPSLGHTIERNDSDGHYEPGNCRWATRIEQNSNRSNTHKITFAGRTMTLIGWARHMGISKARLSRRLAYLELAQALDPNHPMPPRKDHDGSKPRRFTLQKLKAA